MVNKRFLLVVFTALFFLTMITWDVAAQRQYTIEHQWVKIWVNSENGSIDILYDILIKLDSGPNINFLYIGQPQRDFIIGTAYDQYGNSLSTIDASSGSDSKVRVNLQTPLTAGQNIRFNLTTNVARMIVEDTQNPNNVGVQFTPTWWEEARVTDLRVLIVLPLGVTADEVRTSTSWENVLTEDNRLSIYWERQDLLPNQKYTFGLSFPKEYVPGYEKPATGIVAFLQSYWPIILFFGVSIPLIGASGAIFGIMGAFAYSYPRDEVVMPIPLMVIMIIRRVKVMYVVILFAVIETIIVMVDVQDTTAHFAHIGGLLSGFVLAALLIRKKTHTKKGETIYYDSYSAQRSKGINISNLRILADTPELKEILTKIENETVPQVQNIWLSHFLEQIKCPKCQHSLNFSDRKIWCDHCDFKTKY